MSGGRRARRAVVAALVAALAGSIGGCGLDVTDEPRLLTPVSSANPTSTGSPDDVGAPAPVYLVRERRLVAVLRRADTTVEAVAALTAGPTATETASGLSTSLGPDPITVRPTTDPSTAVLEVTEEFAALAGASQLLAVGQVVWTATGVCCATRVEVRLRGRPLPLPTDDGLVSRPVTRADYRSVAPR